MKVMYVFDMTDPEQKAEAEIFANAAKWHEVMSSFSTSLRLVAKHGYGGEQVFAEKWRDLLFSLLNEEGLTLD